MKFLSINSKNNMFKDHLSKKQRLNIKKKSIFGSIVKYLKAPSSFKIIMF
ncbi:hypothetical protein H6775_00110 [Candidatus Nomurabacteria bacterium]|nr:hypothetical protein [Candidatus Nomurabacteria bacterium]